MRVLAPFRPASYRVRFTSAQLLRVGCDHDPFTPETCRPCSVSAEIFDARDLHSMTITLQEEWDGRTYYGWVYEPEGRKALVRLLALAHEHPDPNTMEGWNDL